MLYAGTHLRGAATLVGAVMGSLALVTHKRSAAHRALGYEFHLVAKQQTGIGVHTCDFWNYLTTLLHIYHIAYVKVELFYYIRIVQRGAFHYGTRKEHSIKVGHRSDHTCAPHLIGNLVQARESALGLELIRNGPTRRFCGVAKILLLAQGIDFQHYTIGGKRQLLARGVEVVDESKHLVEGAALAGGVGNFEAPLAGSLKIFVVPRGGQLLAKHKIEVGIELALGNLGRVHQFQRARRGVARVGKQWFAGTFALGIQLLKHLPRHKYLAAYLKLGRPSAAFEHKWHRAYGFHVGGDIVALFTIAACDGLHQLAVTICEGY